MTLPAGELRVLRRMENDLQASEPRLASMFAMFTRLSKGEPVSAEPLRSRFWQAARASTPVYALVVIPLVFAVIIGALVGGTAHGAAACGSRRQMSESSLLGLADLHASGEERLQHDDRNWCRPSCARRRR